MALVFQYGSNTLEERLNSKERLGGAAKKIGIVYTAEDYKFVFTVYSNTNNCAAADIVPGSGRQIWGVLYEIPDERIYRDKRPPGLKCLDQIEGEGHNYKRIKINVCSSDGTSVSEPVITYVVKNRENGLKTSMQYATCIIEGLRSNNIPAEYIDYVKERVVVNNPALRNNILSI